MYEVIDVGMNDSLKIVVKYIWIKFERQFSFVSDATCRKSNSRPGWIEKLVLEECIGC